MSDKTNTLAINYKYDEKSRLFEAVTTTYSNGGANTGAYYNPFRYRGYYYDADLGLYYLNSRYYDATTGRFLNADVYINANGDMIGFNMFAYCLNNPTGGYDPCGNCFHRWDFWNDCNMCGGRNIGNKIWDALVTIADTVYLDFSVGTGFGGSFEVGDISISCLPAREDLFTCKKDAGEGFAVGRTIEKRYGFSVPGCDFNSGYKEFIDGNNQVTTEPITPEFNTQDGVSLQFYFLVGFTFDIGIDFGRLSRIK